MPLFNRLTIFLTKYITNRVKDEYVLQYIPPKTHRLVQCTKTLRPRAKSRGTSSEERRGVDRCFGTWRGRWNGHRISATSAVCTCKCIGAHRMHMRRHCERTCAHMHTYTSCRACMDRVYVRIFGLYNPPGPNGAVRRFLN